MNTNNKQQFKLIVGLGNPDKEYENTRHNIGFALLDELSCRYRINLKKDSKFSAWTGNGELNLAKDKSYKLVLAKPATYMNNSGNAVVKLLNYFKINLADLIVIHDEVALPLGKIRIAAGRGSAGHHGVESIMQMTGEKCFIRLRIGVGPDPGGDLRKDYVLKKFKTSEKKLLEKVTLVSYEALETILLKGSEKAMDKFNGIEIK